MAITTTQIAASSEHISTETKALFIVLFRSLDLYRNYATIFNPLMESRFASAEATVKAKMLNAVMTEINNLQTGEVEIRGDQDGVWWSQQRERQALITEAFHILFDDIVDVAGSGDGVDFIDPTIGVYGNSAVGQRPMYCGICGQYYSCTSTSSSKCGCSVKRVKSYGY